MQQVATEDFDRSYSIKSSAVLPVLCAAAEQVNYGLAVSIDEPRLTADYMLLSYPSIDASCSCMLVKVKLSPAAMSGGGDGDTRGRGGRGVN